MYKRGHEGLSLLFFSPIALAIMLYSPAYTPLAFYGTLIVRGLKSLPDKDMMLKNIPIFIPKRGGRFGITVRKRGLVKHRGITHTIWFALTVGGFFGAAGFGLVKFINWIGFGLPVYSADVFIGTTAFFGFYGVMGHLMGDMITPSGITLFHAGWPLNKIIPYSDYNISFDLVYASDESNNWNWNPTFFVLGYIAITISFVLGDPSIRQGFVGLVEFLLVVL